MKNLIFLILFIPVFCYGQKCKYATNNSDKNTYQVKVSTEAMLISGFAKPKVKAMLNRVDSTYSLWVYYSLANMKKEISIGFGDVFIIQLESGEELIFKPSKEELMEVHGSNGILITSISGTYMAKPEQFEKLAQSKPTKFAITFNGKKFDYKIKDPSLLQRAAFCLGQE